MYRMAPSIPRANLIQLVGPGRQHQDGDLGQRRRLGLDRAEHLPSVPSGHHDVEQDEIGRILMQDLQGFVAVGGQQDSMAVEREIDPDQLVEVRLVVDDQHGCHCQTTLLRHLPGAPGPIG